MDPRLTKLYKHAPAPSQAFLDRLRSLAGWIGKTDLHINLVGPVVSMRLEKGWYPGSVYETGGLGNLDVDELIELLAPASGQFYLIETESTADPLQPLSSHYTAPTFRQDYFRMYA